MVFSLSSVLQVKGKAELKNQVWIKLKIPDGCLVRIRDGGDLGTAQPQNICRHTERLDCVLNYTERIALEGGRVSGVATARKNFCC